MPYRLGVSDSFMIAHSFRGEEFGPAQALHGATYTVEAEFIASELQPPCNWVMDIGQASAVLAEAIAPYHLKNLDELPELAGENTTTEFMARQVQRRLKQLLRGRRFRGRVQVTLRESYRAWAVYESEGEVE
ncbi:hypothetical protein CDCA_CDCA04G1346 [Cyanidium caldarium]|uniref:6-pyruvoyltetrahydropterin synthase n=1 Tax=Cyanidium caldarium TaxID=2771 RepID=A0AAV9ITA3_CYACA|nr:hypothetical protein CDCA_CDCA04G1346 [Cyanidium caldarium]